MAVNKIQNKFNFKTYKRTFKVKLNKEGIDLKVLQLFFYKKYKKKIYILILIIKYVGEDRAAPQERRQFAVH